MCCPFEVHFPSRYAPQAFNDPFNGCKTDPGAFIPGVIVRPRENQEHLFSILRVDADTIVMNPNLLFPAAILVADFDLYGFFLVRILNGVMDEVLLHLINPRRRAAHRW